jgi:hypothetical protein
MQEVFPIPVAASEPLASLKKPTSEPLVATMKRGLAESDSDSDNSLIAVRRSCHHDPATALRRAPHH